jgi:hypothetical protein
MTDFDYVSDAERRYNPRKTPDWFQFACGFVIMGCAVVMLYLVWLAR